MSRPHRRHALTALAVATVSSLALIASGAASNPALAKPHGKHAGHAKHEPRPVKLQILALNDFHGQLEKLDAAKTSSGRVATSSSTSVPAGGAEYLATHLKQLRQKARAQGRHSVTVAAGDLIGASPLLSAAFHDEPSIEAMNKMGLQISSVGNHEFDEGWRELVRMQNGGCIDDGDGKDNQNSCADHTFKGAKFQYLSANVFHSDTGKTVFPGVKVEKYNGAKVGFIGMTLHDTPNIVTKSGVEGLTFTDEVQTANKAAAQLYKRGVKSVVVLVHEGGYPVDPYAYNSCPGISGAIVDIEKKLSPKIDAVITGHTHQAYNCTYDDPAGNPRLVTSASSLGRLVTEIDLSISRRTHDVIRPSERAENHIVTNGSDVKPDDSITRLISTYQTMVAPIANKVIGHLNGTDQVTRTADDSGESPLGNLIADAQKADTSTVTDGKTPQIAFMNPGGIRADLQSNNGDVTYGDAFSVQPFNNYDVAMDMTAQQILTLLQQQWSGSNNTVDPKILQVSGITYSYTRQAGAGGAAPVYTLQPETVKVNGAPLDPAATYRVVANSFLSDGGDGFGAFAQATDKYIGGLDIDAFSRYLSAHDPYTPGPTDRIDVVPVG
jgi:5'-nucleotidase